MKDYFAPDWWYEPPVMIDDDVNDLLDTEAFMLAESKTRATNFGLLRQVN